MKRRERNSSAPDLWREKERGVIETRGRWRRGALIPQVAMSQSLEQPKKKSHKQSSTDAEKPRKKVRSVTPTITEEDEEETKETPRSPKPEITLISGDDDDIFASVNVDEEKDKAAAVGAMWTSSALTQPTALVPWAGAGGDAQLVPTSGARNVWQELARALGCNNLYYLDSGLAYSYVEARPPKDSKNGNEFVSLSFKPFVPKTFLNKSFRGIMNSLLMAPLVIASGFGAPHGDIDEDPGTAKYPLLKKKDASIEWGFRPAIWNDFSKTEDGLNDAHGLEGFKYIARGVEPKIKQAMENAKLGAETWSSCTCSKKDMSMFAIHAGAKILKDPKILPFDEGPLVAEKKEVIQQLSSGTYKASTALLTRLCMTYGLYETKLVLHRLTSARERQEDPACPLYKALTHEQSTVSIVGHLAMPLIELSALRKGATYHPRVALRGLVWMGPTEAYSGMKELTLEQVLDHVPDFPPAPTAEELYEKVPKPDDIRSSNLQLEQFRAKRKVPDD
jgi:hypothetical protein